MMISNNILRLATITVVASFLMLAVVAEKTQAQPLGAGVVKLICRSTGTFITGAEADPLAALTSVNSAVGQCSGVLGTVSSFGVIVTTGLGTADHCVAIASATAAGATKPSPSIIFNNQGDSILFSIVGEQCFFKENGDSVSLATLLAGDFCGVGEPAFSTITATFSVTGGDIDGKTVTGGSGTISGVVDHCAMSGAPFGNASVASIMGTIDLSDDDDDDDDDD